MLKTMILEVPTLRPSILVCMLAMVVVSATAG
jgi:hypothetical protein